MSILISYIVYTSCKDTLKCCRGTQKVLFHIGRHPGARASIPSNARGCGNFCAHTWPYALRPPEPAGGYDECRARESARMAASAHRRRRRRRRLRWIYLQFTNLPRSFSPQASSTSSHSNDIASSDSDISPSPGSNDSAECRSTTQALPCVVCHARHVQYTRNLKHTQATTS